MKGWSSFDQRALHRVLFYKGTLNWMECPAQGKAFDRDNVLSSRLFNSHHAGWNWMSIRQYVTRSANTLAAAKTRTCQAKIVAKNG